MKRVTWRLFGVVAGLAVITAAQANESSFIQRPTRIKGCVAIVDEVRNGTLAPTEWLEQNKEEFKDLELELKARNYPAAKAREFMMGMAISICMERKGYVNKCAVSRGEDGDVQMMATASVYACWTRNNHSEVVPPPPPPPPPPQPRQIDLSPADQAMLNEDLAIVRQPVIIIGDHENGAKEARLSNCGGYWNERLHYNRSQEARNLLWAVRVWRCMFRTNYTVFTQRCPGVNLVAAQGWGPALHELQNANCYARFG